MTGLEFLLFGAILILTILLGLLLSVYLPSYTKNKTKNLATKEDITEITDKMERVRSEFAKEFALLDKRREVYERISDSLQIFIDGRFAKPEQLDTFHSAYSACWLWAPDTVLDKLNQFIQMQADNLERPMVHTQEQIKQVYGEIILGMRRDVGFNNTSLDEGGYKFVRL